MPTVCPVRRAVGTASRNLPVPGLDAAVQGEEVPVERKDQGGRVVAHLVGAVVGDEGHDDPALGGRGEVHGVHADAVAADDLAPAQLLQDAPREPPVLGDDAVGIEAKAQQALLVVLLVQLDFGDAAQDLLLGDDAAVVAVGDDDAVRFGSRHVSPRIWMVVMLVGKT